MMQNNYRCQVYLWDQLVGEMVLVKESVYFKGKIIALKGSMSKPRLKIKEILESLGVKVSVSFTLVLI